MMSPTKHPRSGTYRLRLAIPTHLRDTTQRLCGCRAELIENLKTKDPHSDAAQLQLDMARYTAETDDQVYLQRIREHMEGARRSGVRGTPTFFVNGKKLTGDMPIDTLAKEIDPYLKAG